MINVLIVEDSDTIAAVFARLFKTKDMQVIGRAKNGKEAIELTEKLKPNVITMDIQMPIMDGYEAIKHIMANTPVPIVVISSIINDENLNATFQALDAGAVTVLAKPSNIMDPAVSKELQHMVDIVRTMSEIHVVKRRFNKIKQPAKVATPHISKMHYPKMEVVAIGTSIGGPHVLNTILPHLPVNFPTPIVIVQHMTKGFIVGFAQWLDKHCNITVKIAEQNEILKKGTAYFAPDSFQLKVEKKDQQLRARLVNEAPVSGFCPSVTVLFQSIASACGKNSTGALFTGMGNDGAIGLLELKKVGAHTFIQDQASAVVFGMAGVAESLGAVKEIIALDKIAAHLLTITEFS